ncbi:hypothetical protein F3Y22_tig00110345pilonHSYRG00074 [Hibiscus syriacus]|uniref:DUF676 domain-containing protein n=1 Tax=Hibiscus syriacus TaxID=106335 RepID=A0A6A3AZY6_HIBSY|nr:hypothetical protein F3Y22_tig00110345pilonHSYRG00074 [Hibiscus syriacus]
MPSGVLEFSFGVVATMERRGGFWRGDWKLNRQRGGWMRHMAEAAAEHGPRGLAGPSGSGLLLGLMYPGWAWNCSIVWWILSLEKLAARISWLLGRTGKQLFLKDGKNGKPPLLLWMVSDCKDLKFISALQSFRRCVAYANVVPETIINEVKGRGIARMGTVDGNIT